MACIVGVSTIETTAGKAARIEVNDLSLRSTMVVLMNQEQLQRHITNLNKAMRDIAGLPPVRKRTRVFEKVEG